MPRLNYAIVFVSDMSRSVAFYRDTLGLPLKFESSHWTEFSTEGATLALHQSESASSNEAEHQLEPAGRCRPGLQVANLADFHQRMIDNKVTCVQAPKNIFGTLLAQYLDPDGLTISVSEERRG